MISWRHEARDMASVVQSLWNLTGVSLLPKHPSNFRAIWSGKHPISCFWDFPRQDVFTLFGELVNKRSQLSTVKSEMCSERDSPLEPFVLPAPGQPELARLICGAHLAHLCWPGSRSVHGSIHSCVIERPRFAWRGHPKYCLGCLARSRRSPSVNES